MINFPYGASQISINDDNSNVAREFEHNPKSNEGSWLTEVYEDSNEDPNVENQRDDKNVRVFSTNISCVVSCILNVTGGVTTLASLLKCWKGLIVHLIVVQGQIYFIVRYLGTNLHQQVVFNVYLIFSGFEPYKLYKRMILSFLLLFIIVWAYRSRFEHLCDWDRPLHVIVVHVSTDLWQREPHVDDEWVGLVICDQVALIISCYIEISWGKSCIKRPRLGLILNNFGYSLWMILSIGLFFA